MNKIILADTKQSFAPVLQKSWPAKRTFASPHSVRNWNVYCSPLMRIAPPSFCLLLR